MSTKKKENDEKTYAGLRDDILAQLLQAESFSFDLNSDALYRQYRDLYTGQGIAGARNAYAGAAAMTGGYDNSYAQSLAAQTYGGYMEKLQERGMQLYEAAYRRHTSANEDRLSLLKILNDLDAQDYSRQQDALENARREEQTKYDREQDAKKAQLQAEQTKYDREQDAKKAQLQAEQTQYDRATDAAEAARDKEQDDYNFAFKMAQLGDFSYLKKIGVDVSALEKEAAEKQNSPEKISVTIQNTAEETYYYYGYYSLVRYLDRQIAYGQITEKGKQQIIAALTNSRW